MDIASSISQGLGVNAQQFPNKDAVIQALVNNEKNPEVKRILLGLEPVESMPGYYRNAKENLLIKYNPAIDLAPTFMNIDGNRPTAKSIISPKLLSQ